MTCRVHVLIAGEAEGDVLSLDAPTSFWGGVDAATGEIVLPGHPQAGVSVTDRVLVVPEPIGSSSSAGILLELIHAGRAPAALILGRRDAILPIGSLVARQMGWRPVPTAVLCSSDMPRSGRVRLTQDGFIEDVT